MIKFEMLIRGGLVYFWNWLVFMYFFVENVMFFYECDLLC